MLHARVALVALALAAAFTSNADLWLAGGTVYVSPDAPPRAADVLVRGERIAAVSAPSQQTYEGVTKIDCRGLVVVAGFQNSHVHLMNPVFTDSATREAGAIEEALAAFTTRFGFTTVVDTGSVIRDTAAVRKRIETGEIGGPRILTAGTPLYPPDGVPIYLKDLPPDLLASLPQPRRPEDAVAVVAADQAAGSDLIKLFTGAVMGENVVKPMPTEIARAAVEEAHRRKMLVFAHPTNMVGAFVAIDAGVDVLAHTNSDGWEPSLIDHLIAKRMALVPTIKLWRYEFTRFGAPAGRTDAVERSAIAELAAFVKAGGQVLFGTDVGYMTELDPTDEYRLMAEAGMSATQILASLTTNPAARFGEADTRGTIANGRAADLVILDADPSTDVTTFAKVRYTIRAGQIVYGATPPHAP